MYVHDENDAIKDEYMIENTDFQNFDASCNAVQGHRLKKNET